MKRFLAAPFGWGAGAIAGALLAAVGLAGPASAASLNMNLTATAQYSSSSDWQSDQGNTTFVAAKAFDGDITTRWNSFAGDGAGAWLAAKWNAPVTINKAVLREAFDRITGMRVQQFDTSKNDWADIPAGVIEDTTFANLKKLDASGNATLTIRFPTPVQTTGIRWLFDNANSTSLSVWEAEAWNNPSGTLTGTVSDSSGKPIAGASIAAGADTATSDANGKYTLLTDAGTYNVSAGKAGAFRTRIARGIVLPPNGAATHDFVLLPQPPNLSLTATAAASTEDSGGNNPATNANDGNLTTSWQADSGDTTGAYLEMKWAQAQTFNKVTIHEAMDRIRNYTLQSYDDASATYVKILTADAPKVGGDPIIAQLLAAPVTSTRLRLLVNTADDVPAVKELEVSNAPVATIKGVVTDVATGKPVPNATITSDLGVILGTTDANGAFGVLVEPDDYVLSASAPGYFTGAATSFTISAGDTQNVMLTAPAQGPNIALTATASASTEDSSWPATNVNDGDPTTYWLATDVTNQWVAITWAKPTHFTAVQLQGFQGVIESTHLEVLDTDGKTWVPLPGTVFNPENAANAGNTAPFFFFPDGVMTTGLRFFITATNSTTSIPGLSEMLVYDSPIPKPAQ